MTQPPLSLPQPLDVVPAADVQGIVDATERELSQLRLEADAAVRAAERAEVDAHAGGADAGDAPWIIVRLHAFLDGLREEVQQDSQAMIDIASKQAADRPAARLPIASALPIVPAAPAPAVGAPAPVAAVAPVAPPPVAPTSPVAPPPPVAPAPVVVTTPPAVPEPPAPVQPVPEPPTPVQVAATPPPKVVEPVESKTADAKPDEPPKDPIAEAPLVGADGDTSDVHPLLAPPDSANADKPKKRRLRWLRTTPLVAVIEVVAVLAVMAFVLTRLT